MTAHGPAFKAYIDRLGMNKTQLAKDLGMTKQNLYQLFQSQTFKEETIKNIEKEVNIRWADVEKAWEVNIDTVNIGQKNSPGENQDYKDKYIALLEQRVKELEARQAPPPSIETDIGDRLSKIRADMNYLMSLAVGYSKRALEFQVPDKKKFLAEVRTIQQSVIADPEALLRQGTSSGTDDN